MYKLLLIILLTATTLFSAQVKWAKDFKSGIETAKKEKKPVLFIISRDTCKYCVLLEDTTFKNKQVIEVLNRDFIAIRSWTNENDFIPQDLRRATPGLPGIWFLNSQGEPMYRPLLGYVGAEKFYGALGVVKKSFTTQNNNKNGK